MLKTSMMMLVCNAGHVAALTRVCARAVMDVRSGKDPGMEACLFVSRPLQDKTPSTSKRYRVRSEIAHSLGQVSETCYSLKLS